MSNGRRLAVVGSIAAALVSALVLLSVVVVLVNVTVVNRGGAMQVEAPAVGRVTNTQLGIVGAAAFVVCVFATRSAVQRGRRG